MNNQANRKAPSIWEIKREDADFNFVITFLLGLLNVALSSYVQYQQNNGNLKTTSSRINIAIIWGAPLIFFWSSYTSLYNNMLARVDKEETLARHRTIENGLLKIQQTVSLYPIDEASKSHYKDALHIVDNIDRFLKEDSTADNSMTIIEQIDQLERKANDSLAADSCVEKFEHPGHYLLALALYYMANNSDFSLDIKKQTLLKAYDKATAYIEAAAEHTQPKAYITKGLIARRLGELVPDAQARSAYLNEAIKNLKTIVLEQIQYVTSRNYHEIAYTYHIMGDYEASGSTKEGYYDQAMHFYYRAVASGESLVINLTDLLMKQNSFDEAEKILKPYFSNKTVHPYVSAAYSEALLGLNRDKEAYEYHNKAIQQLTQCGQNQNIIDVKNSFENLLQRLRHQSLTEFQNEMMPLTTRVWNAFFVQNIAPTTIANPPTNSAV